MIDKPQMLDTDHAYTTVDVSEYSYDQLAADKQIGHGGKPLVGHMKVKIAYTGAASGVRIFIVDDSVEALSSPRALAMLCSQNVAGGDADIGIIPITDLDAIGDHLQAFVPPGIKTQRYLGFKVMPVSEALATGTVDSWFDDQPEPPA
jgi:hypothetical protein